MPPKFFSWFFFYLFVAFLIALGVLLFWPGRGLLLPALTPKPERFTELYFDDHLTLPKRVVVGQPYEFSFTIHNLEGESVNYPIEVTAENEATASTEGPFYLYKDAVVISDQQSKTIPVNFKLSEEMGPRVKIEVILKNFNQSVHFWVESVATQSSSLAAPVEATLSSENLGVTDVSNSSTASSSLN